MKKLLALLLIMALPVCAFGEAYQFTVQVKTDAAQFETSVMDALGNLPGLRDQASALAKFLSTTLENVTLTSTVQENAVTLQLDLAGSPFFDMTVHETENASYLTSTLMPGYVLVEEVAAAREGASAAITDDEYQAIAESVENAWDSWYANQEPTVTYGVFQGDAYEGGTKCTTWAVSKQDIAACIFTLLTDDLQGMISQILSSADANAAQILADFLERNRRVGEENKYIYLLRLVEDEEDEFVGLSLTAMAEVDPVATVSVGLNDDALRIVLGLGLDDQNYWWELSVQTARRDTLTVISGVSREWIADKLEGFSYVKETNAPVSVMSFRCNVNRFGKRYAVDSTLYYGEKPEQANTICTLKGLMNTEQKSFEGKLTLGSPKREAMSISVNIALADPIPPLDPSLTYCSSSDPTQAALYAQAEELLLYQLSERLVDLVPPEVLLNIMQMFEMQ